MIRKLQWVAAATIALLCAACDAHFDVPDTASTARACPLYGRNSAVRYSV